MRIAVATLADAVNSRENMLNVLSAGLTTLMPGEYPTVMGVDLAVLIELTQSDLEQDRTTSVNIKVIDPDGETVADIGGELGWEASDRWPQNVPAPVTLRNVPVSKPGRYTITLRVAELDEVSLTLIAAELPLAQDDAHVEASS